MNKEMAEALDKSIKHWEEMISWVEKQPATDYVSGTRIYEEIKQGWGGNECQLCILADKYTDTINPRAECQQVCPLAMLYGKCSHRNPRNAWGAVTASETWGVWLSNAKRLLDQLKESKVAWLKK